MTASRNLSQKKVCGGNCCLFGEWMPASKLTEKTGEFGLAIIYMLSISCLVTGRVFTRLLYQSVRSKAHSNIL